MDQLWQKLTETHNTQNVLGPIHVLKITTDFYVHVTAHRNKFLYNKTNQMH